MSKVWRTEVEVEGPDHRRRSNTGMEDRRKGRRRDKGVDRRREGIMGGSEDWGG